MDPSEPAFQAVVEQAEARFLERTTDEWLTVLRENGMPSSRYNTPHESIYEEQVEANDFVVDLEHPVFGPYRTTGMPIRMEKTPTRITGPSPIFGQHTDDVLTEIGLADRIAELRAAGVVQ